MKGRTTVGIAPEDGVSGWEGRRKRKGGGGGGGKKAGRKGREGVMVDRLENENDTNDWMG